MNHQRTMITRTKQLIVAGAVAAIGLVLLTFVRPDSTDARGGEPAIATVEPSKADAAPQQAAVAWREDFSAALVEAAEKNRPALLRFTAAWCTPCRVMDASVLPDERVISALADRVIPVKIEAGREESADVAHRYGVVGIPTLVLVDPSGKEFARGGFMSAEQLVEFLGKAPALPESPRH